MGWCLPRVTGCGCQFRKKTYDIPREEQGCRYIETALASTSFVRRMNFDLFLTWCAFSAAQLNDRTRLNGGLC